MKVSVICIADRPERLPLLIWSMIAQTHEDWELIILDQGETDQPVDALMTSYPNAKIASKVRYVPCTRIGDWGQTAKEEAAKELALGDVLMFPNDDSYYVPTALYELQKVISTGADIALCGWLYDSMRYRAMPPSSLEGHVDVGGFMISRELFLKVGWQDKSQTGDAKLLASCIATGARVGAYSGVLYVKN